LHPGADTVICPKCGRQNLSCPSCGAGITADADAVVVSCPYCDASLKHKDLGGGTPYFPVHFDEAEAVDRLQTFLLNRFGIPSDFQRRFQVAEQRLVYAPVHLYRVTARIGESVCETDSKAVIANQDVWYRDALQDYRFAMRAKLFMDPDRVRGTVYPIDVSREDADRQAQRLGSDLLKRDRERFDKIKGAESVQLDYAGMIYYPLYEIHFRYGVRRYRSVFDAANGVVCHTGHPVSLKARAAVQVAGLAFMVVTALAVLLFALSPSTCVGRSVDPAGAGGYGGAALVLIAGFAVASRIIWASIRRHRSGEEIEAPEQPIDLTDLTGRMPVEQRKSVS
jgi:hypothetical protein